MSSCLLHSFTHVNKSYCLYFDVTAIYCDMLYFYSVSDIYIYRILYRIYMFFYNKLFININTRFREHCVIDHKWPPISRFETHALSNCCYNIWVFSVSSLMPHPAHMFFANSNHSGKPGKKKICQHIFKPIIKGTFYVTYPFPVLLF